MDPTTVQIALMLALVAGFGGGLVLGGVSTRAYEAAFRARLVRREVRARLEQTTRTQQPTTRVADPTPNQTTPTNPATRRGAVSPYRSNAGKQVQS